MFEPPCSSIIKESFKEFKEGLGKRDGFEFVSVSFWNEKD